MTNSVMQAWMAGVRPGWTIIAICGQEVETHEEITDLLEEASGGKRRYDIVFQKGQGNFGTEAKERADQEKRNRVRLRKTFTFKGGIERTEHRGITLRQLQQVSAYAEEFCTRWHDPTPGQQFSGNLRLDKMNHYHTNLWIIRPATEPKRCSFVELLSSQAQPPTWFLSHIWSDRLVDFLRCIEQHMEVRGLGADSPYWVAAYAVRQHLPQDYGDNLKKTSLFKALEEANFRVLLLLDAHATPFLRTWCVFELIMCLEGESATLDIATCDRSGVEVLTHGLTDEEEHLELESPGAGVRSKVAREETFPIELAQMGMSVRFQATAASDEEDRAYIFNLVAETPLGRDPAAEHPKYQEVNARLASLFAATLWSRAADTDERTEMFAEALRSDVWRKSLYMPLQGMDSAGFTLVTDSFPPNLEELRLHLAGSSINDLDIDGLIRALPVGLKSLHLDLTHCAGITDRGVSRLADAIDFDKMLVFFNLAHTSTAKETQDWYAQMAARNEAAGRDDQKVDVAKALGVSICRNPESLAGATLRAVPATQLLAQIVKDNDNGDGTYGERAVCAYRALGRIGRRALDVLDAEARQVLSDEVARRDAAKAAREKAKKRAPSVA